MGNGQLSHDFVYGDPRRAFINGGNSGITFGVNSDFQSSDANLTNQIGWLYESIAIWGDNGVEGIQPTGQCVFVFPQYLFIYYN